MTFYIFIFSALTVVSLLLYLSIECSLLIHSFTMSSWVCPTCQKGDDGKERAFHACSLHEYHRACLEDEMRHHELHRKEHFKRYGFSFDTPFRCYHPPLPRGWPCLVCRHIPWRLAVVQKRISNREYICDHCYNIIDAGMESFENENGCRHRFHLVCVNHLYPCRECELP